MRETVRLSLRLIKMSLTPYELQLAVLKELKATGADKWTLSREAGKLKELRSSSKNSKRKRECSSPEFGETSSLAVYEKHFRKVPCDDDGFVASFDIKLLESRSTGVECSKAVLKFFHDYGFAVFRNVLTIQECEQTQCEIWQYLESSALGFERDNPDTYHHLSSQTYGLAPVPAVFSQQVVRNRCNPNVLRSFQVLLHDDDLLVSHDRWCAYRPTRDVKINGLLCDVPSWKTTQNLHLDLNPWTYFDDSSALDDVKYEHLRDFSKEINSVTHSSGPNVQGVLALNDNKVDDGGTVLLAGFQNCFDQWTKTIGTMSASMRSRDKRVGHLVWRGKGAGSYKFSDVDPIHDLKQRITMRAGSLLIWDQRVVHGSNHNDSSNFRLAQFVKAFRRSSMGETRLNYRSKRVRAELEQHNSALGFSANERRVLGM